MADVTESIGPEHGEEKSVRRPALFLVLQCDRLELPALRIRLDGLARIEVGRDEKRTEKLDKDQLALGLPDSRVSRGHCTLSAAGGGWSITDAGSKNGTLVNGRAVESRVELQDGDVIEIGRTFFLFRPRCEMQPDAARIAKADPGAALATLHPLLAAHLDRVKAVGASAVPVLILGATGTGKELIASALHELSGRKGPFQAVNCGALPATLIASELFGAVKGAFSGADRDRPGLVRAADGGTLFLDEIGDLSAEGQVALLRVLQQGEVLPVGATRPVKVDVRVVAATNHDLSREVERGQFRADLLARLAGFTVRLPALRERREDLGVLAGAIARRRGEGISLHNAAARALLAYGWPYNVRELEQALLAAAQLAGGRPIQVKDLPESIHLPAPAQPSEDDLLRKLTDALARHAGNVSAVAEEMGKARAQIHRWLHRFKLDPATFRRR